MRRVLAIALLAITSALFFGNRLPAETPSDSDISILLKPEAPVAGKIQTVDVSIQSTVGLVPAGAPLARLPLVTSNVTTSATTLQNLKAQDDLGPLLLTSRDDPDGPQPYRHWVAGREVRGRLSLSYQIPIDDAPNPRGAATPYEPRTEDGAFSGLLGTFAILPDSDRLYRLDLRWDFSSLPPGALGVSTLGVGDRSTDHPTSPADLENNFVMGGALGREPAVPTADGFLSAWQGSPPFDAHALMQWTHKLYAFDETFFESRVKNYGIFLRYNPINAGGGVAINNSFVGTFDKNTDPSDFKLTLAHEMVHTFVGGLSDDSYTAWFSEGLAVYYQRVLPFRAGLISRADFLKDVNETAARYYSDLLNTTPNDEIESRFWADTRVRVLPYDRGSLYFALVDEEMRKASGGARSLDDLVLTMLKRRRDGLSTTTADWREAVTKALGPRGQIQFDEMLAGKVLSPPSDSFGPCFELTRAPMRRYELGFTPDVLIEPKRIVRGLVAGSAAERAGLRNGDEIVKPAPQDVIQSDQHALLHLVIRRDGRVWDISYLPRGETVDVDQWRESGKCAAEADRGGASLGLSRL
jgi:hypothetical protein